MPPIRTFKSAPINAHSAAHPPTSTDETEEYHQQDSDAVSEERRDNDGPAWAPAIPTAAANIAENSYPAARPGAPAMPAPTSASTSTSTSGNIYTPTKTYPASTSTEPTSSPPAPQPGSRPIAPPSLSSPSPNRATATAAGVVPPPPKVGEPVQPAAYYAPSPQPQLQQQQQQQTIPNSTSTPYLSTYQPPSSYTSTYGAGSTPGLPLSQPEQSSNSSNGSIFDGTTGQDILNTAKSWMVSAGNKLAEAEEEVWKMVNKKT